MSSTHFLLSHTCFDWTSFVFTLCLNTSSLTESEVFSHNSIWKLLFPLMFFSVKFHFKEGCLRLLFFQYEAWWFLSSRQLQFRPIFIYCVCGMQQWYNLTRTGFLLGIHKKSMTFQHSSLCPQVKAPTHLTFLPQNQSDKSNTLLHFPPLLFVLSISSFVSVPHLLTSYTCCVFPRAWKWGMISLDTFIIPNSSESESGASIPW